jgi:uncharacterized SAM-binding protein YcdF (DUF218 family)
MFYLLSKTLDALVSPVVWIALLVLVALVLTLRRSRRHRVIVGSLAGALLVVVVAGNPMVANRAWLALERSAPVVDPGGGAFDVVVLLGGVVPDGGGRPGDPMAYGDNVERLLVTFDLLRTDRARHVIISGGAADAGSDRLAEASLLARQLGAWGIAPERILVDDTALNTRQNAIESARLIRERGFERVLLVTSAFHMDRALGCFRAVDLDPATLPVDHRARPSAAQGWDLTPRSSALERTSDALRELTGRLAYRALGYAR